MTALVLEPHQDDATLFTAFNAIRHRAHIVCVLRSRNQDANGITTEEREAEAADAAAILGCTWEQWPEWDTEPDWPDIRDQLEHYDQDNSPEIVFAPAPTKGGNEQHNTIGDLAREVFGARVTLYETYRTGGPRVEGVPVEFEREWVLLKLRALACFESQILRGPVRFFTHALDEWTRP